MIRTFLGIRKCDTEFIIPGMWHVPRLKTFCLLYECNKWNYKFEILVMGIYSLENVIQEDIYIYYSILCETWIDCSILCGSLVSKMGDIFHS